MLLDYSINGYTVFSNNIDFSMKANKFIRNKEAVFTLGDGEEILKSAIIYGPNNTGKTLFVESIKFLKEIITKELVLKNYMENLLVQSLFNSFTSDNEKVIKFKISFIVEEEKYDYYLDLKYKQGIVGEKLLVDNKIIFDRLNENHSDEQMNEVVKLFKQYNNLMVTMLPAGYFEYSKNVEQFFEQMTIISSDSFINFYELSEVREYLKTASKKNISRFKKMIKAADLSLSDLEINESYANDNEKRQYLELWSLHKMKNMVYHAPTAFNESSGTKRFMTFLVLILKALEDGGVIIIDEIDNSLHTLLTTNLLALINNENNKKAQLICTSHDLLLLNEKYIFRKDQIWFTYKDDDKIYFYSLNGLVANKDKGIRNNLMKSYLKGLFGALPHPDIEEVLFDEK